jgi:hypothetical protein
LSSAQIKEAFYNITLKKGEDPNNFILKVERQRMRYNFDKDTCFLVFKK